MNNQLSFVCSDHNVLILRCFMCALLGCLILTAKSPNCKEFVDSSCLVILSIYLERSSNLLLSRHSFIVFCSEASCSLRLWYFSWIESYFSRQRPNSLAVFCLKSTDLCFWGSMLRRTGSLFSSFGVITVLYSFKSYSVWTAIYCKSLAICSQPEFILEFICRDMASESLEVSFIWKESTARLSR
jgi:hypothetical protein